MFIMEAESLVGKEEMGSVDNRRTGLRKVKEQSFYYITADGKMVFFFSDCLFS